MGCLERKRQEIAGQLVAETRNLLIEVPSSWTDELVRGEVYHCLYQAISRAACREVTVDDLGRTQAKPTRVWIMSRHGTVQEDLAEVFPGAQWRSWAPTQLQKSLAIKGQTIAQAIRKILLSLQQTKISSRALKARVEELLGEVKKSTFQEGRDLAIKDTRWKLKGQSLVYQPE
jgi:hypothetical protein